MSAGSSIMASSPGWRTLALGDTETPRLLVKSHFTTSGYDVQLTDLSRVWSEKLVKRDIMLRAWDMSTSIDPSESDEQFQVFLDKIEGALRGKEGTRLRLLPSDADTLNLQLVAPLPKPFEPLTWNLKLRRKPEEALTDSLVTPLLSQAGNLQAQIESLVSELRDKDRVISKITDRLENSGNDLTTVFPSASKIKAKKGQSQRAQLAQYVPGLEQFDESVWRAKVETTTRDDGNMWASMDELLRDLQPSATTSAEDAASNEWWLNAGTASDSAPSVEPQQDDAGSEPAVNGRSGDEDVSMAGDDFQRQETPDRVKRRASVRDSDSETVASTEKQVSIDQQVDKDGDSSTEDEDDLDAVPQRKKAEVPSRPAARSSTPMSSAGPQKKLGALGGRPPKRTSPSPARDAPPTPRKQAPKPRAKLGAIGGKVKSSQPAMEVEHNSGDIEAEAASPPRKTKKMGVIGGKKAQATAATSKSPDATPSPHIKEEMPSQQSRGPAREPTPPPRETSQERADRNRDHLNKELEQKAKAPAKKKRKF